MNSPHPQDLFDQAIALHQRGDLVQAERLYQQILLLEPGAFGPRHMLGVIRAQQGRADDAIALIAAALKLNPQVASAWINLGNVQNASGRAEDAVESYRRALAIEPRRSCRPQSRKHAPVEPGPAGRGAGQRQPGAGGASRRPGGAEHAGQYRPRAPALRCGAGGL